MVRFKFKLLFLLWAFFLNSSEDCKFGYISYATTNIGDDLQALAVKKFLPEDSIPVDREFIAEFYHPRKVKVLVNGWYMHTKDIFWYRDDVNPPEVSWPPSPSIDPFFISIHFIKEFLPIVLIKKVSNT